MDAPLQSRAGIAVVRGNLAPNGAILKPSAADPTLLKHRGPAVVFKDADDLRARIDDPNLDVSASSILVLQNAGSIGYPGMPELGNLPIPAKLLRQGVRDMVRISDARMSGTAYGTVVLHVSPEAAAGGTIGLVRDGDMIELDVLARRLHLDVSDSELEYRRSRWSPPPLPASGYQRIHALHVLQAEFGSDLDFLRGKRGAVVPQDSH
jgi:dihydroxy-acid dehydratase